MTNSRTATVETLTAEVRVLMVGSRQVTMSVYNQLDYVGHEFIDPFGRVAPRDACFWRTYVIGRDRKTGALVSSASFSEAGLAQLAEKGGIWDGRYQVHLPEWHSATESDRARFAELATEWGALPLIILAGLR